MRPALSAPPPPVPLLNPLYLPGKFAYKKAMGKRPAAYWIVLVVAVAAVIAAFVMRRSPDLHTQEMAKYLGWGAIVLLVIARFALRGKSAPEPPMPRD
jgi:hypothetical protein